VHLLCQAFPISTGTVEFACDGLAAISSFTHLVQPTSCTCTTRHFDICRLSLGSCDFVRSNGFRVTFWLTNWTRKKPAMIIAITSSIPKLFGPLDRWGSLNADTAKSYRKLNYFDEPRGTLRHGTQPQFVYSETSPFLVRGRKIVQCLSDVIRDCIHGPAILSHWSKKANSETPILRRLTDSLERAMTLLPRNRLFRYCFAICRRLLLPTSSQPVRY
jgi:hypothetical protein